MRHDRRSRDIGTPARARRTFLLVLLEPLPGRNSRRHRTPSRQVLRRRGRTLHRARTTPAPMHPEVVRSRPGDCPICGMALEPVRVSLDESPNPELIDMNRRMRIGLVLSLPVLVLEMGGHLPGLDFTEAIPRGVSNWIQLALATPVTLWCGLPFFQRGWASLATRNLNMFTLIAMGYGHRLRLQRTGHVDARRASGSIPDGQRGGRRLFRSVPP